jgi:hypothetical protein
LAIKGALGSIPNFQDRPSPGGILQRGNILGETLQPFANCAPRINARLGVGIQRA